LPPGICGLLLPKVRSARTRFGREEMAGLKSLANLKVKDVPSFVKSNVTREAVSQKTWSWLEKYNEKYIQTGSIRPLNDVMISVGILAYFVGWPTELRHLRHAEEAAKHGGKEHH
jgi:hypothetical protein